MLAKIVQRKKSINFTKFDGMQDTNMHVIKFQEEAIEYDHNGDLLAKLFPHSLKDEALKWYFQLPKIELIGKKNSFIYSCTSLSTISLKRFTLRIYAK